MYDPDSVVGRVSLRPSYKPDEGQGTVGAEICWLWTNDKDKSIITGVFVNFLECLRRTRYIQSMGKRLVLSDCRVLIRWKLTKSRSWKNKLDRNDAAYPYNLTEPHWNQLLNGHLIEKASHSSVSWKTLSVEIHVQAQVRSWVKTEEKTKNAARSRIYYKTVGKLRKLLRKRRHF